MSHCMICWWETSFAFSWKDFWLGTDDKSFDVYKCANCSLEQITPMPSLEELSRYYPKSEYYSYKTDGGNGWIRRAYALFDRFMNITDKRFTLKNYEDGRGKAFLDVGCGSGQNLSVMRWFWYEAHGFEISDTPSFEGGIFRAANFSDVDFGRRYDLIFLSHVFEHIVNPREALAKIASLLNPGGICIILLPNIDCFSGRLFGKYSAERDVPRHVFGYGLKNLRTLLEQSGFSVELSGKLNQYAFFHSLNLFLKNSRGIDLWKSRFGIFVRIFCTGFIEKSCNLFRSTNQMGFIIKNK